MRTRSARYVADGGRTAALWPRTGSGNNAVGGGTWPFRKIRTGVRRLGRAWLPSRPLDCASIWSGFERGTAGALPAKAIRFSRDGTQAGVVTSGSFAPTFGRPLAMAYVADAELVEAAPMSRSQFAIERSPPSWLHCLFIGAPALRRNLFWKRILATDR